MKRLLPLVALLALAVAPAHAQLFGGDTEARNQIIQLRQDVQGQIETTSRGQLELAMQNEQMRAEVARLRGQIELLMNEVETLKQRQKDFYVDLDARLRQIETGGTAAAPANGTAAPAPTGNDAGAESADYEAALTLLKNGKQKEALAAFDSFTKRYPSGNFTAGAHFWAGNAALQSKDLASATRHFKTVTDKCPATTLPPTPCSAWPTASRPSATPPLRATLKSLTERYPQSNAAQVARQR